jgi:hypothetical protein
MFGKIMAKSFLNSKIIYTFQNLSEVYIAKIQRDSPKLFIIKLKK